MACIMGINKNACRTAWLINEIWCQTQVAEHPLLIVVAPVYCLPPLEFQECVSVWEVCGFWGVCATQFSIFGKLFFCVVLDFLSWVSPGLGRVEGLPLLWVPSFRVPFWVLVCAVRKQNWRQLRNAHTQERSSESRSAATSWHQAPSPPSRLA